MIQKRSRSEEEHENHAFLDVDGDDVEEGPSKRHRSQAPSISTTHSPTKRARLEFPQTPISNRARNVFATPTKPFTPYPLKAYDSPSNPFGRKRPESLIRKLPPPTSFSKHLALRFQFIRRGIPSKKGGVYRVVQVPLSYTFVHLRCLISFLFGKGAVKGASMEGTTDHLFEIKREVELYNGSYKPGQIKNGATWAKLSSTQDPCRNEADLEQEDVDESEEQGKVLEEEGEGQWEWKDEEDFTVHHAWPKGMDDKRGIVYTAQVHITLNKGTLERRRGCGNSPYVFSAKGRVRLSPISSSHSKPLRALFKSKSRSRSPQKKDKGKAQTSSRVVLSEQELTDTDADGEVDPDNVAVTDTPPFHNGATKLGSLDGEDEDEESDDDAEEDFQTALLPEKWNYPEDAFSRYFSRYMGPLPSFHPSDDEDEPTQPVEDSLVYDSTMDFTSSLAAGSSSPAPVPYSSSPQHYFPSSSPQRKNGVFLEMPSPSVYRLTDPNSSLNAKAKMKQTPAPSKDPSRRIRRQRLEKSLDRSKMKLKARRKKKGKVKPQEEEEEEEEGEGDGTGEEEEEDGKEGDEDEPIEFPDLDEGTSEDRGYDSEEV